MHVIRWLIILAALVTGTASAQTRSIPVQLSLSIGPTVRGTDANALGDDLGAHAQLSGTRWLQSGIGVAADFSYHFFPTVVSAVPGCAPGSVCEERRSLSHAAGGCARVLLRPIDSAPWLGFSAGAGMYWAGTDNFQSDASGSRNESTLGLNGSLTLSKPRSGLPGIVGEARMHYFPSGLGEIRWLFAPAVRINF